MVASDVGRVCAYIELAARLASEQLSNEDFASACAQMDPIWDDMSDEERSEAEAIIAEMRKKHT